MRKRTRYSSVSGFVIVFALALLFSFSSVSYAVVSLDQTFGDGGLVIEDYSGLNDRIFDLALDNSGRVIITGYSNISGNINFIVGRFQEDGQLDPSFGTGGLVNTDLTGNIDTAYACVVDSQDHIVVAGSCSDGSDDFALVRYLESGDVDTTFGEDGIVTNDFFVSETVYTCAIDSNGRIIVAGDRYDGTSYRIIVARYEESGDFDSTFGYGGALMTDFNMRQQDHAYSCVVDSNNRIVLAGIATNLSYGTDFGLVRFLENGDLDTSFGNSGFVTTEFSGYDDRAKAVVLDNEGRIVVAGYSQNADANDDFAVARYLESGDLDVSFGNQGLVSTGFPTSNDDWAEDCLIDSMGKILVAGQTSDGSNVYFALARYDANGSLDESFGNKGLITTSFNTDWAYGRACVIDGEGRIVMGGDVSGSMQPSDFALARYVETQGPDDPEDPASDGGCNIRILPGMAGLLLLPVLFILGKAK